jgi:hypothetical protein
MDLAAKLQHIQPRICPSPWRGYEHFKGYGVMVLPFSSGHLLGLRVFPENDFAPYVSVWHRTPEGEWSIFNDGPSLETTCPRWWGPALKHTELTRINIRWTGPRDLRVEMNDPPLSWTMTMNATPLLRSLNPLSRSMPLSTWRHTPSLKLREWMAKQLLGMGDIHFSFTTPSGHQAIIMPEQNFFISDSKAILKNQDLGHPVKLEKNPTIGKVPLPVRPVFIIGQSHAKIKDMEEYRETKEALKGEYKKKH